MSSADGVALSGSSSSKTQVPTTSTSRNKVLVIDSGALFHGCGSELYALAEQFVTVPEVVSEIRDEAARHLVASFPFQIALREPSEASLLAVAEFSKLTGDYPTLSKTDLRVLALTHTVECELNGGIHIRAKPFSQQQQQQAPQQQQQQQQQQQGRRPQAAQGPTVGSEKESSCTIAAENAENPLGALSPDLQGENGSVDEAGSDGWTVARSGGGRKQKSKQNLRQQFQWARLSSADSQAVVSSGTADRAKARQTHRQQPPRPEKASGEESGERSHDPSLAGGKQDQERTDDEAGKAGETEALGGEIAGNDGNQDEDDDDSDGDGYEGEWITPSMLQPRPHLQSDLDEKWHNGDDDDASGGGDDDAGSAAGSSVAGHAAHRSGHSTTLWRTEAEPEVGCVTTDYAMQNVLLQMNLRLVSVNGMRIRKVKQWVLRCFACFNLCKDMTRKFCPICGNNTLLRISITTNSKGVVREHINYRRPIRTRGTVYSLPNPTPGCSSGGGTDRHQRRVYTTEDDWILAQQRRQRSMPKRKPQGAADVFSSEFLQDALFERPRAAREQNNNPRGLGLHGPRASGGGFGGGNGGSRGASAYVPIGGIGVVGGGRRNPNEKKKRTGNFHS